MNRHSAREDLNSAAKIDERLKKDQPEAQKGSTIKEDRPMKNIIRSRTVGSIAQAVAVLVVAGLASTPAIFAAPKPKKAASSELGVVAHLRLENGSATHLVLVKRGGRQYLYAAPSLAS